jgi:hypothetical protein
MNVKLISGALLACSALAACGNTAPPGPKAPGVQTSALTPEQVEVLANGVEPNVVRDAVDGGKVATF